MYIHQSPACLSLFLSFAFKALCPRFTLVSHLSSFHRAVPTCSAQNIRIVKIVLLSFTWSYYTRIKVVDALIVDSARTSKAEVAILVVCQQIPGTL